VIGLGLGTAEAMLVNSGLSVGSVTASSSGTTAGAVVRTNPGAFSSVPRGTPVNIVVDAG
jgi:beta-lactam-binding protein with PASTA domain